MAPRVVPRLAAIFLLAASLAAPVAPAQTVPERAERAPVFHAQPCPKGVFPRHLEVDCGFVRVPENRAKPDGRTIRVAAAVVRARTEGPTRAPIVFLDGGPSFGAIAPFAVDAYIRGAAYSADRDFVLVDTRGTGTSQPRLGCPEFDRANVRSFYSGSHIDARRTPIFQKAVHACHDRLRAEGIGLRSYNSREGAADLDALRRALGYDEWNLLAISADGVLGSTYLRLYPDRIRSVILDSPIAPQHLNYYDYLRGLAENLDRVFDGCEADPECDATYPGLRNLLMDKVAELNADPVVVPLPDFEPEPVNMRVDGAWLWYDAAFTVWPGNEFEPEAITWMLDNMWRATHGDLEQMERDMIGTGPITADDDSFVAMGKTMSYLCRDVVGFMTPQDREHLLTDLPWLAPDFARQKPFGLPVGPAGCRIWDVGRAGPAQHRAVVSDVPTLVLAGELDPAVPAYLARQADDGLTNATYVEMPAAPHLQLSAYTSQSWCAREIAAQFLAHPGHDLDLGCVDRLPAFDYSPPPANQRPPGPWRGSPAALGGADLERLAGLG